MIKSLESINKIEEVKTFILKILAYLP